MRATRQILPLIKVNPEGPKAKRKQIRQALARQVFRKRSSFLVNQAGWSIPYREECKGIRRGCRRNLSPPTFGSDPEHRSTRAQRDAPPVSGLYNSLIFLRQGR